LRFAADIVGDGVEAAHLIDDLACQVSQLAAGRADRLLRVYSVEKLCFSVLALFRQLVIESVSCQQDSVQPIRANSGEANVVER
jgi:hypothetical protein